MNRVSAEEILVAGIRWRRRRRRKAAPPVYGVKLCVLCGHSYISQQSVREFSHEAL